MNYKKIYEKLQNFADTMPNGEYVGGVTMAIRLIQDLETFDKKYFQTKRFKKDDIITVFDNYDRKYECKCIICDNEIAVLSKRSKGDNDGEYIYDYENVIVVPNTDIDDLKYYIITNR